MTIISRMSSMLPSSLYKVMQPKYQWLKVKKKLKSRGAKFNYNKEFGGWVIELPMLNGKNLIVLARTFREFRRVSQFGTNKSNVVWKWINWIEKNNVIYDVGSANGLEGFAMNHLSSSHICFIEPYTPSVETILKTAYLINQNKKEKERKFDIIHAGCTEKESYSKLIMHSAPIAGQTRNTYETRKNYEEKGGRDRSKVVIEQWVKGITLDSLVNVYKLKKPNYIKIDVDGHEESVLKGAKYILKNKLVKSWCIEITGKKRIKNITDIMFKNDYEFVEEYNHYPNYEVIKTVDRVFVKKSLKEKWNTYSKQANL